jgi:hypothetical protein
VLPSQIINLLPQRLMTAGTTLQILEAGALPNLKEFGER